MLEKLLHFSVKRRWVVVLLTIGGGALGVWSFRRLPIDAVPDITNNQAQINTLVPAFSPEQVERQVTFPIETALAGIPGLQSTRSLSRNGFSQVTAVFADNVDIYFARNQINERLIEARRNLPHGVEPKMGPITTGLGEVCMWTVEYLHPRGKGATLQTGKPGWQADGAYLTSEGQRLETDVELASYLREVQDWVIRPQLKNIEGVAGIDVVGGYEKQYHVQPDPMKLIRFGITFQEIIEGLDRNNVTQGAGYIEERGTTYPVSIGGLLHSIEDVKNVVVGEREGTPIRVRDLADVRIGSELRTGSGSKDAHEVVIGTAMMLIGANSRTVAAAVEARMVDVNRSLPPDIRAETVYNRTKLVKSTIDTVAHNLAEGAILVIVILFLMLGSIPAAIITALAIPLSMLMTATGMVESRISGNLMSLGAIDFGIIVDGAVIIVENCLRMLAEKQHELKRKLTLHERLDVVFHASKQVRSATAFGEAIIITVYLPILALTGTEGKMFRPMAMTVIFALVAAFVLSLTFIPAMVAICVRGRVHEKENFLVRLVKRGYEPTLKAALRLRWLVVPVAVLICGLTVFLFFQLGQEFTPTLDEQDILVSAARATGTSLTDCQEMQLDVEKAASKLPEVALVYSKTGTAVVATDPMPPNFTDTFVILKPRSQWPDPKLPKDQLVSKLDAVLQGAPGTNYTYTQPIQMRFNELMAGVRGDVAVKVYGDDFNALEKPVGEIAKTLKTIPGAADVKAEEVAGLPAMSVEPNREALSRYGLSITDVQSVIATAIGGREAGQIQEGDRRFDLVVRLPDSLRSDLHQINNLPVPLRHPTENSAHQPPAKTIDMTEDQRPAFLPLSTLAKVEVGEGLNQISRDNGKRRIVVQCNVRSRDIGSFVEEAQDKIAQIKLPSGSWLDWGGQFENLIAARKRFIVVIPLCFFSIFLLLFSTFNSVKHAMLVFSGVPLALTGGVAALWLRDIPFSISAAVGFIALSGVAVLNGLVMLTFINQLRRDGKSLDDAIVKGSMTRLRPVMMTALVASLGFVPMALATGTGAEVQRPLATVVIGGIVSSTLLTLIVLPALYRMWHRDGPIKDAESRSWKPGSAIEEYASSMTGSTSSESLAGAGVAHSQTDLAPHLFARPNARLDV
jgi:cobalt-zinc-cadmium resistance protein CzcA